MVTANNVGQAVALQLGWTGEGQGAGGHKAWVAGLTTAQKAAYDKAVAAASSGGGGAATSTSGNYGGLASGISTASNIQSISKVATTLGATAASTAVLAPLALMLPGIASLFGGNIKAKPMDFGARPTDLQNITGIVGVQTGAGYKDWASVKGELNAPTDVTVRLADGTTAVVKNINPTDITRNNIFGTMQYDAKTQSIVTDASASAGYQAGTSGYKLGGTDAAITKGLPGNARIADTIGIYTSAAPTKTTGGTVTPTTPTAPTTPTTTPVNPLIPTASDLNNPTSGYPRPKAPTPEQTAPIKEDENIQNAGRAEVKKIQDQYGFEDTILTQPESLLTIFGYEDRTQSGRKRGRSGIYGKSQLGE